MPGLAGGGLPDAEQIITADASGYLRALDEIIRKNDSWINKTREMQREAEKWQKAVSDFGRNMPETKVDVKTDEGFDRRIREMQRVVSTLADTALAANRKMAEAWDTHTESVHEVASSYEHAGDALGDFRQHVQDGGSQVRSLSQDMAELGRNAERTAAAIDRVKASGWTPEALAAAARANAEQSAGAFMPVRYYAGPGGGGEVKKALDDINKGIADAFGRKGAELMLRALEGAAGQGVGVGPKTTKWMQEQGYENLGQAIQGLKDVIAGQEAARGGDAQARALQGLEASRVIPDVVKNWLTRQAYGASSAQEARGGQDYLKGLKDIWAEKMMAGGPAGAPDVVKRIADNAGVVAAAAARWQGDNLLLQRAVESVVSRQAGSAAALQRDLEVGSGKVRQLMGQLEGLGVVGPSPGRGVPRAVLAQTMADVGAPPIIPLAATMGGYGVPPGGRMDTGGIWPVFPGGIVGGGDGGGGGGGFAAAAGGFFGAIRPKNIFGGALPTMQMAHLITMFAMEVLSTVIPAAVAAGAAGMVGLQAGQSLYQRGTAMWNAAEALGGTYGGQTLGRMVGLSSNLQQAQDLAQGGVFGIGGAIKDMIGQGGGAFTRQGVQTIAMINRGMTAMVLNNRMKQLTDALGGGTGFLRTIGDIGANLGDTLLNMAPNLPGMGPMLFKSLEGITGFMRSVSGGLPGTLLGAGLAGEAGWRWGKLVLGGGKLPGWLGGGKFSGAAGLADRLGLGAMSRAATAADVTAGLAGAEGDMIAGSGLAGLLETSAGPLGLGMALSSWLISRAFTPGAQKGLTTDMARWQTGINQSFGAGALTPIKNALYGVSAMQAAEAAGLGPRITDPTLMALVHRGYYTPQQAAALQQKELGGYAQQFAGQLGNLVAAGPDAVKALQGIGMKGMTLTQAFEMMTMAMVGPQDIKGGKLDATARGQLQQLAQTYQTARIGGQPGTATGLLMAGAADYIMSTSQMKSLAQINQGLDAMTQIMTGGPAGQANLFGITAGAPAAVAQAMVTAPGARLSTAQQNRIANAMKGDPKAAAALMATALSQGPFGGAGGAAWNQFAGSQGMMAAQQANMDQIRTYMTLGAISGQQGAQLGAFDLKSMLPFAAQSPMAQYMLEQQAMQANIPGIRVGMKYSDLVKAVSGTAVSQQGALGILTQGTKAVADLPAIAAALITGGAGGPSALQSALLGQMAQQGVALAAHPLLKGGGVNMAALQGLTSSLAAGGVTGGKMQLSVDAVLKNLHVPSDVISKINAAIGQGVNVPVKADTSKIGADLNKLQNKVVTAQVKAQGTSEVKTLQASIDALKSKTVQAAARAEGAAAVRALNAEIAALHDKIVTILVRTINQTITQIIGGGTAPGGIAPATFAGTGAPNMRITRGQTGMKIPGYGGGDIVPAMLEPGELVVPKHMVAAGLVGHLAGKIPGFQTGGFVGQSTYGSGAYWGAGSQMALWNPALLAALLAAMRASQGTGVFDHPQGFRGLIPGGGGGAGGSGSLTALAQAAAQAALQAVATASKGGAGQQFAIQVIQGLTGHIKNLKGETSTLAKELVNKLEQEVKYATGVAQAAAYGQGYDPSGRGSGIFGSMNLASASGLTQAQLHSSPTGNIKDYNAYVAAYAAGTVGGPGPQSVQDQMKSYLGTLKSFGSDITKLRKEHLNKDVMAQIIAAGPQQGDQIAQSIMGGQGGVGAVNKLWQQIQKASKGLGAQAAMAQYGGHLSSDLRHGQVSIGGVTINVSVGGGKGGTLDLTPSQIAQIVAAVQAALLRQSKKNNKGGVKLPGKGT